MKEIEALRALADPDRAAREAGRHKSGRETLGLTPAAMAEKVAAWRQRPLEARLALSAALWEADLHESRLIAPRLLAQARIDPDQPVWELLTQWLPDLDGAVLTDALATALQKRVAADPGRMDEAETWLAAANPWMRRAAMASALPFAKLVHPKPSERVARERAHDWAATLAGDAHGAVQQGVAVWLRTLAPRDPDAVRAFIRAHGTRMKPHALAEARRALEGHSARGCHER
ncbi:DNA alkylation repair protein [Paracoccus bogoriensis]|uniref:DNA alkylation repair protein n=1 Tax=Paracoccus bogoriensis TaxID=242065 RepID=UPI001C669B76|nr:DNA alkylation repair protein [Paracoccus bogoriensis]MBW7055879.1 DNA alkylation repair protein [Paracoccus bogoriensis]